MKPEKFNELTIKFFENCKDVLSLKAGQYSQGDDRLSNFKHAAAMEGCTPERALRGMLTKHLVSIYDFIDEIEDGKPERSKGLWQEKLTDAVNYIGPLLLALLHERYYENMG